MLYRISNFGLINPESSIIDKQLLKNSITIITKKALLFSNMVYGVKPTSCFWHKLLSLHLDSI